MRMFRPHRKLNSLPDFCLVPPPFSFPHCALFFDGTPDNPAAARDYRAFHADRTRRRLADGDAGRYRAGSGIRPAYAAPPGFPPRFSRPGQRKFCAGGFGFAAADSPGTLERLAGAVERDDRPRGNSPASRRTFCEAPGTQSVVPSRPVPRRHHPPAHAGHRGLPASFEHSDGNRRGRFYAGVDSGGDALAEHFPHVRRLGSDPAAARDQRGLRAGAPKLQSAGPFGGKRFYFDRAPGRFQRST